MSLVLKYIPSDSWSIPSKWELNEDFNYNGYFVPKGFVTDGITSPRVFYPFFNPSGKGLIAAIIHDYELSKLNDRDSRKSADDIFKHVLSLSETSVVRINLMYFFVRLYGIIKVFYNNRKR